MFASLEYMAADERLQQLQQDVHFPIYKTNNHGELYKVCSFKKIISLRWDDLVKGIGVSEDIEPRHFLAVFNFDACQKEEFTILLHKILIILNEEED
jgi:hypothetical protein